MQVAGLDVLIPFTGGLLLGQGFIRSTYVHMGFRIESGAAPDPDGRRGGLMWVKRTFSHDYSRSVPPVGDHTDG